MAPCKPDTLSEELRANVGVTVVCRLVELVGENTICESLWAASLNYVYLLDPLRFIAV